MFGISPHSWKAPKNAVLPKPVSSEEKPKKSMTSLYAGDADVYDPYLSPVFGDYNNFPPMLIQVGTFEVLLSDSETIYEKAKKSGKMFGGMKNCAYLCNRKRETTVP